MDGKSNYLYFYIILFFYLRYNFEGQNVWTCADWAYGLNDMFQSMNLQYWQTVVKHYGIHTMVKATCYGESPRYYDPWLEAPLLYGFQVFPSLPPR
mgnify:CR=1 FL=1